MGQGPLFGFDAAARAVTHPHMKRPCRARAGLRKGIVSKQPGQKNQALLRVKTEPEGKKRKEGTLGEQDGVFQLDHLSKYMYI